MQARMRQMSLFAAVAAALVVTLGGTAFGQSNVGAWKLDVAKSKFTAGTELKSGTTRIEAVGAGIKVTVDTVGADGTARHWEYSANYDGNDNPISGNSQNGDVVAQTRFDTRTTQSVYKKDGKVTITQTSVVSADGKTRTVTSKGTNVMGKPVDNVNFYDKQ